MKKVIIIFMNKKAEDVYYRIEETGKKESRGNKIIVKSIIREKIISTQPLTVELRPKIKWLFEQAGILDNIKRVFLENRLIENKDFKVELIK